MTIETSMVFALGFLTAALLSLGMLGAVWRRAVRLTTRRVENAMPLSFSEIKAEKDQIRADYAVITRRLEIAADGLREELNLRTIELARRAEVIRDINTELDARAARIAALDGTVAGLQADLAAARATIAGQEAGLKTAAATLAEREAALAERTEELAAARADANALRIDGVALRTRIDSQTAVINDLTRNLEIAEADIAARRKSFAEVTTALTAERQRISEVQDRLNRENELTTSLRAELAELNRTLAETARDLSAERRRNGDLTGEVRTLQGKVEAGTRRVEKLTAELAGQKERLAEETARAERERQARDTAERTAARGEAERDRLTGELAALRASASETARALQVEAETAKAAKNMLEGSLAKAREDRLRIQREVAALTQSAQTASTRDARDIDLLRERMDSLAATIARVTQTLEGPDSRIAAILTEQAAGAGGGRRRKRADLTLAERIRLVVDEANRSGGQDKAAAE